MHNENKLDEMCKIPEHLHQYVPSVRTMSTFSVGPSDEDQLVHDDVMHRRVLIFGDQLTSARVCGAQAIRSNHDREDDKLQGLIPATADWHARVILLRVSVLSFKCLTIHRICFLYYHAHVPRCTCYDFTVC